jgi:hypothetical protein
MRVKLGDSARVRTAKRRLAGNLMQRVHGGQAAVVPVQRRVPLPFSGAVPEVPTFAMLDEWSSHAR